MFELSDLLKEVSYECICGKPEQSVTEVVYDSRKVQKGCMFICITGANVDGHDFAQEVVDKGADVLLVEREPKLSEEKKKNLTIIKVEDTRYAMAHIAAAYYGHPARELKTIGITGTKGKTTDRKSVV